MSTVSIVVPTLNPGKNLSELRKALVRQSLQSFEVVIVDSASTDGSPEQWRKAGFRVLDIERADFDHGGTRNLGSRNCRGSILVFMTQDSIPADERWLENLISPIVFGEAVAAFARQLPREDAGPLERYSRAFNYPPRSRIVSIEDLHDLGIRAFFFSNACSAVRADVFCRVRGFPEGVIFNEDIMLCARLLRAGYKVKYESEARVLHSHRYGLLQQFRRTFDNGVSFSQAGSLLEGARTGGEGLRFVLGQAGYVWRTGNAFDLLRVFVEAAIRFVAFNLGKREQHIPLSLKRRLSMHENFWVNVE
jgi:rhamnosyltransferase